MYTAASRHRFRATVLDLELLQRVGPFDFPSVCLSYHSHYVLLLVVVFVAVAVSSHTLNSQQFKVWVSNPGTIAFTSNISFAVQVVVLQHMGSNRISKIDWFNVYACTSENQ